MWKGKQMVEKLVGCVMLIEWVYIVLPRTTSRHQHPAHLSVPPPDCTSMSVKMMMEGVTSRLADLGGLDPSDSLCLGPYLVCHSDSESL